MDVNKEDHRLLRNALTEGELSDLTEQQREMLANGYKLAIFENNQMDKNDYFTWLGDAFVGSLETKVKLVQDNQP